MIASACKFYSQRTSHVNLPGESSGEVYLKDMAWQDLTPLLSPAESMLCASSLRRLKITVGRFHNRVFDRTRASLEALSFVLFSCVLAVRFSAPSS
jgi:hypothetical protein